MSVFNYRKYKISLHPDTKKVQGLRTGDIVRRQYRDGNNLVESLMCVLDYGVDKNVDTDTYEIIEQPCFIGALLEGSVPTQGEMLDFARITNLFDTSRSGALYLSASDDHTPFMDIIDGIAYNESLCWPVNIANTEYIDSKSQYVVSGGDAVSINYEKSSEDNERICHILKTDLQADSFIGLKQDFYQYIANPDRVLISYKIKASQQLQAKASLAYTNEARIDGEIDVPVSDVWEYKLHAITVDWSGRHLRTFKLDLGDLPKDCEVWIADLNIILLSSIANFHKASKTRIGKLSGVSDPVFGELDGYGGYLQKLFASNSTHISGTLTAGDENGFASTFYAGKIHRNTFINSIDVNFITPISIDNNVNSPTGLGQVYIFDSLIEMVAQTNEWLLKRIGSIYCFSFWLYAKQSCQLSIMQNSHVVGTLQISDINTHSWHRHHIYFELFSPSQGEDLLLSIIPTFELSESTQAPNATLDDECKLYFSAPQLEKGKIATQYQPTDNILDYSEDYGAWFNRGGIGGTIQNPLLQLNYDGEGSIGTRTKSFLLRIDGSGYIANENIKWDKNGKVTFGSDVTLNWDNISESVQKELVSKSIKIVGADTFIVAGNPSDGIAIYSPITIDLSLEEENIQSTSSQRQWYYLSGEEYIALEGENGLTFSLSPDGNYWTDDNILIIKCVVTIDQKTYSDTITIKKIYTDGYSIIITSKQGEIFKNGECQTILTANVYYQGVLLSPEYVASNFVFNWSKYNLPDLENEDTDWYNEQIDENGNVVQEAIDRTKSTIVLNYKITGSDLFTCELRQSSGFPYIFPITFYPVSSQTIFPDSFPTTF